MIKIIKSAFFSLDAYVSKSIQRMMIITFTIVLCIPILFILPIINQNTSSSAIEKSSNNQLLFAKSFVEPTELYFKAHEKSLTALDKLLLDDLDDSEEVLSRLKHYVDNEANVVSLSFFNQTDSSVVRVSHPSFDLSDSAEIQKTQNSKLDYIISEKKYRIYDTKNTISSAFNSTFSKQNVILFRHHLLDKNKKKRGTLFIELGLKYIQGLCSGFRFGSGGECLVIDDEEKIIAANNQQWVSKLQKISRETIISEIRQNDSSGKLVYFSNLYNTEIISSYVKIDKLGWTVLVISPTSQLENPLHNIIKSLLLWMAIGILVSLLIAYRMVNLITRPLHSLVVKVQELDQRGGTFTLGKVPRNSPSEISVLWTTISNLIKNSLDADDKVNALTKSSVQDVRKIVVDFRIKNLLAIENIDPLTGVATHKYFEKELGRALVVNKKSNMGVIMFEIDNFQSLSEIWKKEVTVKIIRHVGGIIKDNIRGSDMVARYNNSAQFIVYINQFEDEKLDQIAQKLCSAVEETSLLEDGEEIYTKLSFGAVNHNVGRDSTIESVISSVSKALSIGHKK